MSTREAKEAKEPREQREQREQKEQREQREPKHRPDALRQPQRKDSLTTVLTYLQGRTVPLRPSSTSSPSSAPPPSSSLAQGPSKQRRYSHGGDLKKKARTNSHTLRRSSFTNLAAIKEDASTKTKSSKTAEAAPKITKPGSSEKVNKTADIRKKKSQSRLAAANSEAKPQSAPPPMPIKGILRVSSPDGQRPPPRHIRSYSSSAAIPGPDQLATITGLSPLVQTTGEAAESDTISQPGSPIVRPLSPGATVRFAKATVHRVEVGPGRRFMPVKRRSKSTVTYLAPLDPVSPANTPKVTLQSPTKLRRHQENQAAMGRYWMRMEEEEAQQRAEAERRAAEEAERYRAEPSSPPVSNAAPPRGPTHLVGPLMPAPSPAPHSPSLAERLATVENLPLIDSILPLDKVESIPTPDAEDKLETVEADSDDSDAESDGGASTAMDEEGEGKDIGRLADVMSSADVWDGARLALEAEAGAEGLAGLGTTGAEPPTVVQTPGGTDEETETKNGAQADSSSKETLTAATPHTAAPTNGAEKPAPSTTATQNVTPTAPLPANTPTATDKPESETTQGNAATAPIPAQANTAVSNAAGSGASTPPTTPKVETPKPETAKATPKSTPAAAPAATTASAVKSEKPVAGPRPEATPTTTPPVPSAAAETKRPNHLTLQTPEHSRQHRSLISLRPSSPRSTSPRPMSPMTALRHKKTMMTLSASINTSSYPSTTTYAAAPAPAVALQGAATTHHHQHTHSPNPHSPKLNHLQLSSSRRGSSRPPTPYSLVGEQQQQAPHHKQEIAV